MNGGYIMIDGKGMDLTKGSTSQTISGLYAAVKTAMASDKPVLLYNCIYGSSKPCTPVPVYAYAASSTSVALMTGVLVITCTNANAVTIADQTAAES